MPKEGSINSAEVEVRAGDDISIFRPSAGPGEVMFKGLKHGTYFCDMSVRLLRKTTLQLHGETGAHDGNNYPSAKFILIVNGGVYSNPPYNGVLDADKSPEGVDWNDWDGQVDGVVTFEANMDYWIRVWATLDKCNPINTLVQGTVVQIY